MASITPNGFFPDFNYLNGTLLEKKIQENGGIKEERSANKTYENGINSIGTIWEMANGNIMELSFNDNNKGSRLE